MLEDGGVGAGIGIERAEGDCFGDKMIFFYYIKLFVFSFVKRIFFQSFGSDGGRHRFSLSIRICFSSWAVKFGSDLGGKAGIKVRTGTKA